LLFVLVQTPNVKAGRFAEQSCGVLHKLLPPKLIVLVLVLVGAQLRPIAAILAANIQHLASSACNLVSNY